MIRPRIGLSIGDPGGIGPEIICKAIPLFSASEAVFKVSSSASFFERMAYSFEWGRIFVELANSSDNIKFAEECNFTWGGIAGEENSLNGLFAYKSFEAAVDSALNSEIDALVTAPLSKNAVEMAVKNGFRGHTEYLRDRAGLDEVVMMLVANDFRVVPMTRHIPISEVSSSINERLIRQTIEIVADSMKRFEGIERPVIGVLALNPHAGDNGLFGTEEAIIAKALSSLKNENFEVDGPLVPDVAFIPRFRSRYDTIIGMYHDQVLIPLKMAGFERGVNATLGLPYIRTSPDHGTAFDIAGHNIADPSSMLEAIRLAIRWSNIEKNPEAIKSF